MSASEYLKGLPSYNENNFARFQAESTCKVLAKRPTVYISTKDYPKEQRIITEKTNILLRFLTKNMEKKNQHKKRDSRTSSYDEEVNKKRARLDGELD